jgi:uncharacterized protein
VILPDVNLLLYAYDTEAPRHRPARQWWEARLGAPEPVGLSWIVILGFVRMSTHASVFREPRSVTDTARIVRSWLERPQVVIVHPGERHADLLLSLLEGLGTAGNLTTDAHLAALAIEHQAELCSTDADFARFPGLRWSNRLAG